MIPLNNASPALRQRYASRLKHLKFQCLQTRAVDAYAIRTMGEYQPTDYFHQRIASLNVN